MHATAERPNDAHPAFLQRKCGCGGSCDSCGKKKKPLDRAATDASARAQIPPVVDDVLRSPGQPLATSTRAMMESRFQHDFTRVRVHTGSRAAESAHAVSARAYTVGSDVVFSSGMYQPQTTAGQHLLAHELTHVVQQAGGVNRSATGISSPGDATERAADRAAETVMAGGTPSIGSAGAGVLHREPAKELDSDPWQGNWATCKIDFAKWGDWSNAIDCCANIDPLGKGCVSDLKKLRGKLPGKNQGPKPKPPGPWLPGQKPDLPPIQKCFPPEEPTFSGGCCSPGERIDSRGQLCVIIPKLKPRPEGPEKPPEKPPEAKPTPPAAEIAFQFDKPSLASPSLKTSTTSEGSAAYEALLKTLRRDTALKVTLIGRASPEGKAAYNEELGGRRASAVADALIADGVAPSRIADAPGGVAGAKPVREGVVTTGETGATGKTDRQVRVVFFR